MLDVHQCESPGGKVPRTTLKRKSPEPSTKVRFGNLPQNKKKVKSTKSKADKVSLKGDAIPLGKFLASNDKTTRDRAVAALRTFISSPSETSKTKDLFSKIEINDVLWASSPSVATVDSRLESLAMAKLFKGIFYCYWMSDKPPIQQQLANELADLCLVYRPNPLPSQNPMAQIITTRGGLTLWRGFWEAVKREWHGVDRHRLDKYLLLLRRYVERGLRLLQRVNWHPSVVAEWSKILKETVFDVSDVQTPMSLAYHVCDVFLEEVNRALETLPERDVEYERPVAILPIPIDLLLAPFCHALSQARPGTVIHKRIIESVIIPLFENIEFHVSDGVYMLPSSTITIFSTFSTGICVKDPKSEDGSSIDLSVVKVQLLKLLFETGAHRDCLAANRKKLYALWASRGGVTEEF